MNIFLILIAYIILTPLTGGLLTGLDRIITARMQSRIGPPLLQPFYDVAKLFSKENLVVRKAQNLFIIFHLLFLIVTGALFFCGGDFLLVVFAFALAGVFFILGGYRTSSPYSHIGSERELIQMMAYEPMLIITAIGLYMTTHSFNVFDIMSAGKPLLPQLLGIFLGFLFILPIKMRKSPFDLSMSHHAHQELVKGITTEFSGPTLALLEIAHWFELILILGIIILFFPNNVWLGLAVECAVFFLVILVDNTFARLRWQTVLKASWLATFILGMGNIFILSILKICHS
ncbi:MAG: NADH-quinone oxidoreductase subunit H [Candidatus Omnitrophica bacterium]|nr:NADH-quinone oxidoreductase subunit H [Candidatus Omnitrophota bacterium]